MNLKGKQPIRILWLKLRGKYQPYWHADSFGVLGDPSGNSFGDDQWGKEWSVRLVRDDVSTAFIEIRCGITKNRAGCYSPEEQYEYLIGTVPGHLASTETWSRTDWDSPHMFDYETPEEAVPFAEEAARYYALNAVELFGWWDGTAPIYQA